MSARRSLRIVWMTLAAALLLVATATAPVGASHLEEPRHQMEELGFHDLGGHGFNTDVWAWTPPDERRLFATSGTWGTLVGVDPCPSTDDLPLAPRKSGVKIVDATDPADPVLRARIGTIPGSQNNDVKVLRLASGPFAGRDLLVHSLEPCGAILALALVPPDSRLIKLSQTGFELYDVTEPSGPVHLGTYNNGGLGTHNLYPFNRPDLGRSFVAAVFNESPLVGELRGELQIVEVTDPTAVLPGGLTGTVATWELADAEAQGGPSVEELCRPRGTHLAACLLHDVWTSEDGTTAYLSFWDAGLILLDITDPAEPRFLGQIQSGTLEEEGNTHAAVPMTVDGRDVVVVGDEDFVGPGPAPHVTIEAAPAGAAVSPGESFLGTEFTNTRPLSEGAVRDKLALLPDDAATDGSGCSYLQAQALAAPGEWVAVARRGGTCPLFQQKVTIAEASGAAGLIVVNNEPGSVAGLAAGNIPAMMIPQAEGDRLIASIDMITPQVVVTMELLPTEEIDPWGFMRVIDATDPASMTQVATFKAPHVDSFPQFEESVFSAHNPIVGPEGRVYFSWYTNGVRVLELSDGGAGVTEAAWFVPLPTDHEGDNDSDPHGVQEDNIGFWGSYPICDPRGGSRVLVFNSDFNRGLYVVGSLLDDGGVCPGEPPPPLETFATGGGQVPGSTDDGPASFGFNARDDGTEVRGHIGLKDHGTGQRVVSESITSVTVSDGEVVVLGTCRIDGGAPEPCRVRAVDRGEPGTEDEFHLEVGEGGASYSAGGTLLRGNVQVHRP